MYCICILRAFTKTRLLYYVIIFKYSNSSLTPTVRTSEVPSNHTKYRRTDIDA
jgi:hypothetical protein